MGFYRPFCQTYILSDLHQKFWTLVFFPAWKSCTWTPFPGHFPLQCRSPLLLSPCHSRSETPSLLTCSLKHLVRLQICCFHCRVPVHFYCLLPSSVPISRQAAAQTRLGRVGINKPHKTTEPSIANFTKKKKRRKKSFCDNEITKSKINLEM